MKRLTSRVKAQLTKKNLKALRKEGKTYAQIAKKLGMTTTHLYYYANKLGVVKHA